MIIHQPSSENPYFNTNMAKIGNFRLCIAILFSKFL